MTDSIGKNGFMTFLAIGIVNSMGPTLNVIAADGLGKIGERLPLLHLMLNPFSQVSEEVGTVEIGESWNPAADLETVFSLNLGACPTLLLPSALYSHENARNVFTALLQKFRDGTGVLARLRKHPGDPWQRIEADMSALPELMKTVLAGSESKEESKRLTATEAAEFAELQLQNENSSEEFRAFMFAWEGSINFTGMETTAMSKEAFLRVFGNLALTLRVPFMRNIIDDPDLLKS